MSVEDTTAAALDIKLRSAHSCVGIGRTAESACSNAIVLALKKVQQQFDAAELSLLKIIKYPGFRLPGFILQTLQIQQHASLGLVDEMTLRESAAY